METHLSSAIIPIPETLNLTENHQEIIIEKKWFRNKHIAIFLFSLIWNAVLLFFYSAMILGQVPVFVYFFPLLHVVAGAWMVYYSICGFFNKTIITANKWQVFVQHKPLPWTGQKKIDPRDISQLYVKQQIHTYKGTTSITYEVQMINRNNKAYSLIKGLESSAEAKFIESKLENFYR